MKNIYIIIALAILIPFNAFTENEWNVTNKWFSYNKLEKDLSYYYYGTASVVFEGKIFYFATYLGGDKLMVVREVSNVPTPPDYFTPDEDEHYEILKYNHFDALSQPAPVVFNGKLYLFYQYQEDYYSPRYVAYVTYQGNQEWSDPIVYPESKNLHLNYGAAVQIGDNLCLATYSDKENLQMNWTTDPTNPDGWSSQKFAINNQCTRTAWYNNIGYNVYTGISLIAHTYLEGTAVTQKLMLANIDSLGRAHVSQLKFNSSGQLDLLRNDIIESELTYQSIALAQGSVENDPSSTGNCTQLFVKNAKKDNKYHRYRILRYQLKEGEPAWTLAESNLVPQNDPIKMWGDSDTDITAVNYDMLDPTQNKSSIQRYIALLYRGDNDQNYPLLCAWAKSDYLIYSGNQTQDFDCDPSKHQYIGFFEGPPPFFLNPNPPEHDIYQDFYGDPLSSLEYSQDGTFTLGSDSMKFETKHTLTAHIGHLSPQISSLTNKEKKENNTISQGCSFSMVAGELNIGYYIYTAPKITMTTYWVYDWRKKGINNPAIYPTFSFLGADVIHREQITMPDSVNTSKPQSFMNKNRQIDFGGYNAVVDPDVNSVVTWLTQSPMSAYASISKGQDVTNTSKKTLTLSSEFKYLGSEKERTIEYESTVTTTSGNTIEARTSLNNPDTNTINWGNELSGLEYQLYWLKYTPGQSNWWVKDFPGNWDGSWCVTYNVMKMSYQDGTVLWDTTSWGALRPHAHETSLITDSILIKKIEDINLQSGASPLKQNNPNPFIGSTKIKYTVGIENIPENSTDCLTRLVIYNLSGQRVATLVNENKAPGSYEVEWDASQFTPGVYFYSLQSGSFKDVKKMVLLK